MKYFVPLGVVLLAQTSWPVSFLLSKYDLMTDQFSIFIAGVVCLSLTLLGSILLFNRQFRNVDPMLYVMSFFCWTCMIDLGIGLELDGYISDFMGFYFIEGEPYLKTAHGTLINYWDGTGQFAMCIITITLYCQKWSHREMALYWVGSIMNSMIVLLKGGLTGVHPFKMSYLLNTPYLLCPLIAGIVLLHKSPPQARTFLKYESLLKRPVDLFFAFYFLFAIAVGVFRGLAVCGGNSDTMKEYLKTYEPYMLDPNNFPKIQILTYEYIYVAYYLFALYGLLKPGCHWMADWSLIHAGASAQSQVSYIGAAIHHRTPKKLRLPMSGFPATVAWTINLALLIVPQLFALWCLRDFEKFGRTYSVDRAELIETKAVTKKLESSKDD